MIIVKVNGSIDRALKILKNKTIKIGMLKELRDRQKFTKKSEKYREELKNAKYSQRMRDKEENEK